MKIGQPIGQKRLTNVAVVRLRKAGCRFEVACYKNKVVSWRDKTEKDIDEVLQAHTVFANVSKGLVASSHDLKAAFGTDDHDVICRKILDQGEFQVSDKERDVALSSQFRDVATTVMDRTINPATQRPYTMGTIERLMRDAHFSLDPHKGTKQQALELIRELEQRFPIRRARMKLSLSAAAPERARVEEALQSWGAQVEMCTEAAANGRFTVVYQVEPGRFRECEALAREVHGRQEVVSMAVQQEGSASFDTLGDDDDGDNRRREPHHGAAVRQQGVDRATTEDLIVKNFSEGLMVQDPGHQIKVGNGATASPASTTGKGLPVVGAGRRDGLRCTTCRVAFDSAHEHREHFKSEWHRHNLRRKVQDLPPLSAADCLADVEIEDLTNDLDQYSR